MKLLDVWPPSSVHNILHGILDLYPYRLQSYPYHEILPVDTKNKGKHLLDGFSVKSNRIQPESLTSGQTKFIFRFIGTLILIDCCIRVIFNPHEYSQKPLYSPKNDCVVCIHKFVHHRTFLLWNAVSCNWVENGYKECWVLFNASHEKVMPCLQETTVLSTVYLCRMEHLVTLPFLSRNFRCKWFKGSYDLLNLHISSMADF